MIRKFRDLIQNLNTKKQLAKTMILPAKIADFKGNMKRKVVYSPAGKIF